MFSHVQNKNNDINYRTVRSIVSTETISYYVKKTKLVYCISLNSLNATTKYLTKGTLKRTGLGRCTVGGHNPL